MVVTDESLELIARSFKNFKVLVLSSCEGFTTDGLASIAANCRLFDFETGVIMCSFLAYSLSLPLSLTLLNLFPPLSDEMVEVSFFSMRFNSNAEDSKKLYLSFAFFDVQACYLVKILVPV